MQSFRKKNKMREYYDLLEKFINLERVAMVLARKMDQNRKKNDTKFKKNPEIDICMSIYLMTLQGLRDR